MIFGYNNKKTNIKVNILLAAFLEIELYDNIDCHVMINSLFKKNIGIWTYIYKNDDGYCHPAIAVNSNNKTVGIFLDKSNFTNKVVCFKTGLKIILAYICYLANDDKISTYNIVEHEKYYVYAINQIIDMCKASDINLKANYNKYHATIDCCFPDLIESILI